MKTYVVGHKNPDTDSVVSAIALADLEKYLGKDYSPAIAGKINKETSFVLEKFGVAVPEPISSADKKVVVVDVNEPSQLPENVKHEEIIAIYDHHKLGGLSTPEPISIRVEPLGSTSTIIAQIYRLEGIDISEKTAKLLLAGIISDTLNFSSPTTTDKDKETAEFLNKTANIDIDSLAQEMFKAKSDLSGFSSLDLVEADYKTFDINGRRVGIAVFETVDPAPALAIREEIVDVLTKKKAAEGLDYLFLAVIDIFKKEACFISPSEEDRILISKAFTAEDQDGILRSAGIVSRKKQIVPAIEKAV